MRFNFQKIFQKILKPFKQGLNAKELTKAIIISVLFTIIPVLGITTLILTFISIKHKLNLPIMILISYLATPLQFLLFLPFIHFGESIFNVKHTLLTITEIKESFEISFFKTLKDLIFELICGFSGWLIIALPTIFLLFIIDRKLQKQKNI